MSSKYSQLICSPSNEQIFFTEGGLETTLQYIHDVELTDFAAYLLLRDPNGCAALTRYYEEYGALSQRMNAAMILDTPTWRCNPDWLLKHHCDVSEIQLITTKAVDMLLAVRDKYETGSNKILITGAIGPRGDGYALGRPMSVDEARNYHDTQIACLAATAVDIITMFTVNYIQEGIGAVLAAKSRGVPIAISFTVETDGRLPDGSRISEAIEACDEATDKYTAYYMLNCAHPTHFIGALSQEALRSTEIISRIRCVKVNASCKSHADLNLCTVLDMGDPQSLAEEVYQVHNKCPSVVIFGGCCGTDTRHISAMISRFDRAKPGI